MNKPLLAGWITAIAGFISLRWLMISDAPFGETTDKLITLLLAAVFFVSALLFSKGAARSPVLVRRIAAWVMCGFVLLYAVGLLGFLILRALG